MVDNLWLSCIMIKNHLFWKHEIHDLPCTVDMKHRLYSYNFKWVLSIACLVLLLLTQRLLHATGREIAQRNGSDGYHLQTPFWHKKGLIFVIQISQIMIYQHSFNNNQSQSRRPFSAIPRNYKSAQISCLSAPFVTSIKYISMNRHIGHY